MFEYGGVNLGIAPLGWTNDDMPDLGGDIPFEQCISEMALAGFVGTEIGNKYPKDGAVLKKALALRGLTICNAWFSAYFTAKPQIETVDAFIRHRDFLYEQGARIIGCSEQGNSIQGKDAPILGKKPVHTPEEWKKVTQGMNLLARLAEEKGMRVCLHHHMGTGVQTPEEIDRFMDMTDPAVGLLYDSGHIVFSEGDADAALTLLEKHIGRVWHVHFKDVRRKIYEKVKAESWSFLRAVREGVFTIPGDDGMTDFKPLLELLDRKSYRGWIVVECEQDPAIYNPLEYAIKARRYIRETAGL